MPVHDSRLRAFVGVHPPAEWMTVIDGSMHKFDPDTSMRWCSDTYKLLLDLTKAKNLSVVFVGSQLDADHARKQFESIGQMSFPWMTCIDDYDNAVPFILYAKFVIGNQSPLVQLPAQNGIATCQLEVDANIPRHNYGLHHVTYSAGEHYRVSDWINTFIA